VKKLTRQISGILFLMVFASCSSEIYQATWQTKPVIADGTPNEWSLPLRYSDSKSGLQYNITNDKTNLYVCIRATEQPIQMKIISSGMEIWLDPSGKNKETVGIQFPLPGKRGQKPMSENMQKDITNGENSGRMNMAQQFQLQEPQTTLSGFLSQYNGTFMATDAKEIKVAINWNEQNFMTYELVIPLKSFSNQEFNTLKYNPVIGFKININAMAEPGSGSHAGRQGGPPGGAGQGPPGGGVGEGGMTGGSGGGPGRGGEMGERPQSPGGQPSSVLNSPTTIKFRVKMNGLINRNNSNL